MIQIFYGPKYAFESILPVSIAKTTLVELARKSDAQRRLHLHYVEGQEKPLEPDRKEAIGCLVSYSDEYAGISDHAIQSFISFIDSFDIKDIFLQNPPGYIVDQLEKSGFQLSIKEHEHKCIGIDHLKKFYNLYDDFIVGQVSAKKQLVASLYPAAKGRMKKPSVILFYGPTGVGKTETAKLLANVLGERLLRRQFSMFHSNTFADYLFGGEHSKNSFAKDLLERESNIILLDEFDKPNPIFFSAFYQLFDEGVFEDKNYTVKVNQAFFICTSNFLSVNDIRNQLGDPIFSRFDAIIKFNSLPYESVIKIIDSEFEKQVSLLDEDEGKIIESSNAYALLIENAEKLNNARLVKRVTREVIYGILTNEITSKA